MKDRLFTALLTAGMLLFSLSSSAQQKFDILHGPYLQEVTQKGATVVFQTSLPSYSYIELRKENSNQAYKNAAYRIVLTHFPMVIEDLDREEGNWGGWCDALNKFLPILNKSTVDLVVSGHTHRFKYHEIGVDKTNFPQLVQGAMCATRLDIQNGTINIKVLDTKKS